MIRLRLDIDGNSFVCRTFKDSAIQINRRVQDIKFLESSQGVITQLPFTVPVTDEFVEAIGDVTNFGRTPNVDIRKVIPGSVLYNSVAIFRGSFQILKFSVNPNNGVKQCELIFKGNETNLKYELQNVKLKDLLDGETLPYNIAEIASYYNNPTSYISTNGYTWDLIDYGQDFIGLNGTGAYGTGKRIDDSTAPLDQRDFKPSITIQKIIDKIDSELGITLTNDSEINHLFDAIIPLHNNKSILPVLDTSPKDFTGSMSRTNTTTYVVNNNVTFGNQTTMNFNLVNNYNQTVFNVSSDRYTVPALPTGVNGNFTFELIYDFTITESGLSSTVGGRVEFFLFKNGVSVGGGLPAFFGFGPGGSFDFSGSYTFDIDLVPGDYLTWELFFTQNSSDTTYTLTYTQNTPSIWKCVSSPNFTSSSNVLIAENIDPDKTCWDVVKDIIYKCNGVLVPIENGFNISPWVDWVNDSTTIFNLNEGIDPTTDIQIEPTGITGPKSIRFTYPEGKDKFNKLYTELTGDRYGELYIADTGSDFAQGEETVESPFINAVPVLIPGTVVPIIKMIDENGELIKQKAMIIPKASYRKYYRIELKDFYGGTAYAYDLIPATTHWYTNSGGFTGNDQNFGTCPNFFAASGYPNNTLYERYWREYIRSTYGEKARKVTVNAKMTHTKFKSLEMNEIAYLQQSKFRMTAITGFNVNSDEPIGTVEMMQRVTLLNSDIAPYYPYDTDQGVVQWKDSSDNSDVGDGSAEPAADIEASCKAYGFYYESSGNVGIQVGILLTE